MFKRIWRAIKYWKRIFLHDFGATDVINQRIFDTTLDLILVVNSYGDFIRVSPSSKYVLGYDQKEMQDHHAIEFIHPDDLERTKREMKLSRHENQTRRFDCRYLHRDGHAILLAWTGLWSAPEHQYFFIGRDMTKQRQTEDQLRQSQKMEAIGNLTGGLAHDFNNMLGVIIGNLDAALPAVDEDTADLLTEAIDAATSAAELTRSLLAFSRQQPLLPQKTEINPLITNLFRLLRRGLGEKIVIKLDLQDDLWSCVVDPVQLESTLTNLSTNARDAMPKGGRIMVTTANRHLDEAYASLNIDVTPGDYTTIEITDTGSGMPPEVVSRIFDPFFTTKPFGTGTGLGLSMVFGFIKQSNGHISVYSEPGVGTTFRLYFPRAKGDDTIVMAETQRKDIVKGDGEMILVVEDNERMRKVVMTQLKHFGYNTIETGNPEDAIKILDSDIKIDVLFSDIVMPGKLDGIGLAKHAIEHWPDVRILLTSGFPGGVKLDESIDISHIRLISKPYRADELATMLHEVLHGCPAARVGSGLSG